MITRRDLIKGAAAAGIATAVGCAAAPRRSELVIEENLKPGTTDWLLTNVPKTKCRSPQIEGYATKTSVRGGETVEFKVSTNPAAKFVIDLYRLGYYGGKGGRLYERFGPFQGSPQPDPPVGVERVRECAWETAMRLTVPGNWPSGVYLAKLTANPEEFQSYIIFIVRDDRECDFLFQCSDTTWSAYNRWPDLFSLYDDGTPPHNWYVGPGVRVGWDRPYGRYRQILDAPLSQGSGEYLLWEFPLAFWMEQQGYDVSYISNMDTHADPARLRRSKAFLSVGHDEYWSRAMFDNLKAAIDSGVNAAFFSGNSVDGLLHILPSAAAEPRRIITRVGKFGVFDHEMKKFGDRWKEHGPNPATLMGARSTFPYNGSADWTCTHEKHWLFEGTGMKNGDRIPGLVGWEHHGLPAEIPGLEVVARGPVFSGKRPQNVEYTATIHPGPKRNLVFNAATIWWSDGLSAPPGYLRPSAHGGTPPGPDARVQRITRNLFERFLA